MNVFQHPSTKVHDALFSHVAWSEHIAFTAKNNKSEAFPAPALTTTTTTTVIYDVKKGDSYLPSRFKANQTNQRRISGLGCDGGGPTKVCEWQEHQGFSQYQSDYLTLLWANEAECVNC